VSCGRKIFNVNSSEIAAECLKMFGVSDLAEVVATRKDRCVKKYVLNNSVVCEICALVVIFFSFQLCIHVMCYRFR